MSRPSHLSTAEAADWLGAADAPRVLDVRTPAEFAGTRIPGAINVPLDVIEADPARIGEQLDGEVLLVCRTDNRAGQAQRLLAPTLGGRGHVLTDGMTGWERDSRDVERGEGGPWAMERQVRTVAGSLVLTGVLASLKVPAAKWLAAGIGGGLLFSGLSDTCGMAALLGKLPYNRREQPTVDSAVRDLQRA